MDDPSKRRERLTKLRQDILEKKNATTMGILDNLVDMKKTYTRLGDSLSSSPSPSPSSLSPELSRRLNTPPDQSSKPSYSTPTPLSPERDPSQSTPSSTASSPYSTLLAKESSSSSFLNPTSSSPYSSLLGKDTSNYTSSLRGRDSPSNSKRETATSSYIAEPTSFVYVGSNDAAGSDDAEEATIPFGVPFSLTNEVSAPQKLYNPDIDLPLPPHWTSLIDPVENSIIYYNEFSKEATTIHPYYFQNWNVDTREGITVRQALAEDGWDKYLDPNTNQYFYYNTNTGETTWSLPVHRYVGHVAPSTLSTILPTTQRALKKELDIEPRKVDAGLKPMSMVGDKWYYAPEDVAEFNTNHPVASSILFSIHEELVSLPEPSLKADREGGNIGDVELDLWDLYNEEMTIAQGYAHHTELSVVRPPWYWRSIAVSPRFHLLLALKRLPPRFLSSVLQGTNSDVFVRISLWSEKNRLTDDFVANLSSTTATPRFTTHTHATLFTAIQLEQEISSHKLLDMVVTIICGSLPTLQKRVPITLDPNPDMTSGVYGDVTPVSLLIGSAVDCNVALRGDVVLELTLSLFRKQPLYILEDQPITPPPPITLTSTPSLFLGVTDFIPNVRNDAYITVMLDQVISRANKGNIRLPSTFYILATLSGWRGTAYPSPPSIVGWYPVSEVSARSAQQISLPLPRAALEDAHMHLLFYFVAPKKAYPQSTWKVPDLLSAGMSDNFHAQKLEAQADWPKIEQIGNPQTIQECLDSTFAFAYLIMYPKPGQFRADDYYELQMYEGKPPASTIETVTAPGPYSSQWRDIKSSDLIGGDPMGDFAPTPLYLSFDSPRPFNTLHLSVSLRVMSGAILDDPNLQFLLEETTSPMDKLATLAKSEGHLLEKTHVHDIAKFYGYLLSQIGKLYLAQLQIGQVYRAAGSVYKSNATLPPLFTLFTYVLSAVVHVECQHPLLQQDFEDSLYNFVPAKFLRDYIEYLSIQLDEVFVSTPTPDPHAFPFSSISSCMCFLLSSLMRKRIQGVQQEDIAQNLLEERFLRDKVVKVFDVFMLVLAAPPPVTQAQHVSVENNKRAVVHNLAILYPYFLGLVGFTTVMRLLRAVITNSFTPSAPPSAGASSTGATPGTPTAITRSTLVLLAHIYQFQPPPQTIHHHTLELYIKCALLPYISPFLTSILSAPSTSPPPSTSSSTFSTSDFFLELSHCIATLFLAFFPLLTWHATDQSPYFPTWQVSKPHILTLCYASAFPIFTSSLEFLRNQCKRHSTVQGILYMGLSSFFTLGAAAQNGKLLRQSLPFHLPSVPATAQFLVDTFKSWKRFLEKSPFPGDTCGIRFRFVRDQVTAAQVLVDLFLEPIENLSKPQSATSLEASLLSPFSHLLSFIISFLELAPPNSPGHAPTHPPSHLFTYSHTLHFLHSQCQKRRAVVFKLAREVVPILARLFASPSENIRTMRVAHTPTTTHPDTEISILDLAAECFVAFLISNFWADGSFESVEAALYEFVCGVIASNIRTQAVQESLDNISHFLNNEILRDPLHLFAREFSKRLDLEVEFSRKISVFTSSMVRLLDNFMLIFRVENNEIEVGERNEDTVIRAILYLLERGEKLKSATCIHFADQLVKLHRKFEDRKLELAHTILLKFRLLRKFRGVWENVLSEENLALYKEAIGNFNLAHDFESAIYVCQNLITECEKSGVPSDLKQASKFLSTSALLYKNLATIPRISPLYYAVYFYGSGFPSHLDGATFVYRINETQNFTQFTEAIRAQFPNASLLLPGSRTPVIKPVQVIKFLPALPGIELDKFEPSATDSSTPAKPKNEPKYKPQFHSHLTTFYTYLESTDESITSPDATYTLQVWNRNFVPSYIVDAATFTIPKNVLNSSSLAPSAPPIYRVQMICDKGAYLPGISRHVNIANRFTSLIPAAQACVEWVEVQTNQLLWLINLFHKRGKTGADWCGVCGKRDKTDCEKNALAKISEYEKSESSEELNKDWKDIEASATGILVSEDLKQSKVAEKYLRHVLHNILNPEINQVVGLKKCRFVLEQENLRKDQMLAKIKQETGKAYIKERKRCQELGLEIPQKPELIDLVPDPASSDLEQKLNQIKSLLEYATLLHMRMSSDLLAEGAGELESGMEAHGELEILLNSLMI